MFPLKTLIGEKGLGKFSLNIVIGMLTAFYTSNLVIKEMKQNKWLPFVAKGLCQSCRRLPVLSGPVDRPVKGEASTTSTSCWPARPLNLFPPSKPVGHFTGGAWMTRPKRSRKGGCASASGRFADGLYCIPTEPFPWKRLAA